MYSSESRKTPKHSNDHHTKYVVNRYVSEAKNIHSDAFMIKEARVRCSCQRCVFTELIILQ